jgi:hypothetical protein
MSARRTKLVHVVAMGVIWLVIFEVAAAAFWKLYGAERVVYHMHVDLAAEIDAVPDSELATFAAASYHPRIGWNHNANDRQPGEAPADKNGARATDVPFQRVVMSSYGDSFVFGSEVGPRSSFQYYLSLATQTKVVNYGVGGYGPDQAVMLLQEHLASGVHEAPVVLLGMPAENIARVVNMFPLLYWAVGSAALLKPVYVPDGDGFRLQEGPGGAPLSRATLRGAIDEAQHADFWFAHNDRRPRPQFPYLWTTVRAAQYFSAEVVRFQDLYGDARAVATLHHVLDVFVGLARRNGFTPVYLMIPMRPDVQRKLAGKPATYAAFLDELRRRHADLIVVDALEIDVDFERFYHQPGMAGHLSDYGQQLVAAQIYRATAPLFAERR